VQFVDALEQIIPNSEVKYRKGIDIKKIIPQAIERGFTNLVVVNENHKEPSILYNVELSLHAERACACVHKDI
jgi:rRNA maturation protein Rpf1